MISPLVGLCRTLCRVIRARLSMKLFVVYGFTPPDKFYIPHIGLLWGKFRSEYPNIQHAIPVASATGEIYTDSVTNFPIPRIFFINESDDQLIQVQSDRFYYNWRRRKNPYPRYAHVIKNFEQMYSYITSFFSEFGFGEFKPIECELS